MQTTLPLSRLPLQLRSDSLYDSATDLPKSYKNPQLTDPKAYSGGLLHFPIYTRLTILRSRKLFVQSAQNFVQTG